MEPYQGVKQINQEEYVIIQPYLMLLDYKIFFKIKFLKVATFKGLKEDQINLVFLKKKKYNFSQIHLFKKTFKKELLKIFNNKINIFLNIDIIYIRYF